MARTKKEIFLEQAIESAREEALEEILALKEGADMEEGLATLTKILDDLFDTAKNFEKYDTEEEEEPFYKGSLKPSDFKFEIGESVKLVGQEYNLSEKLFEAFGISESKRGKYKTGNMKLGEVGRIIARTKPVYETHRNVYVVEYKGSYSFIEQGDLIRKERLEDGRKFERDETVIVRDEEYVMFATDLLLKAFSLSKGESYGGKGIYNGNIAKVRLLANNPYSPGKVCYMIEKHEETFFVSEEAIEEI